MTNPSSPVERLVDLVVFAPLGLALRARDELPKLAAYGRDRFDAQARVARMVGQMTVAQARRQVESVLHRPQPESDAPVPAPAPPGRPVPIRDLEPDDPHPVVAPESSPVPTPETAPSVSPPLADDLAIPGYDSLSASQVVQRLPGLSSEELEAVRAYEQAGRNRQTILLRVAQLRAAP
jgi:hypothetical protein